MKTIACRDCKKFLICLFKGVEVKDDYRIECPLCGEKIKYPDENCCPNCFENLNK